MEVATYSLYARAYHTNSSTRKETYWSDRTSRSTPSGRLVLYYSFNTVIAFIDNDTGYMTRRWYSPTTVKHQGYAGSDIRTTTGQYAQSMIHPEFRTRLLAALNQHDMDSAPAYAGR